MPDREGKYRAAMILPLHGDSEPAIAVPRSTRWPTRNPPEVHDPINDDPAGPLLPSTHAHSSNAETWSSSALRAPSSPHYRTASHGTPKLPRRLPCAAPVSDP